MWSIDKLWCIKTISNMKLCNFYRSLTDFHLNIAFSVTQHFCSVNLFTRSENFLPIWCVSFSPQLNWYNKKKYRMQKSMQSRLKFAAHMLVFFTVDFFSLIAIDLVVLLIQFKCAANVQHFILKFNRIKRRKKLLFIRLKYRFLHKCSG